MVLKSLINGLTIAPNLYAKNDLIVVDEGQSDFKDRWLPFEEVCLDPESESCIEHWSKWFGGVNPAIGVPSVNELDRGLTEGVITKKDLSKKQAEAMKKHYAERAKLLDKSFGKEE